jgi:hypothetical protein
MASRYDVDLSDRTEAEARVAASELARRLDGTVTGSKLRFGRVVMAEGWVWGVLAAAATPPEYEAIGWRWEPVCMAADAANAL